MKSKATACYALIFMVCLAQTAFASPTYYIVNATITNIYNMTGLQYGINIGDSLQYTFETDLDRQGKQTNQAGVISYPTPFSKYFYADLLAGDLIIPLTSDNFTPDRSWRELNYGYLPYGESYPEYMQIYAGGNGSVLFYNSYYQTIKNYLYYYDTNDQSVSDQFDMIITHVTSSPTRPANAVPLPGSIFLLGTGLTGLTSLILKNRIYSAW